MDRILRVTSYPHVHRCTPTLVSCQYVDPEWLVTVELALFLHLLNVRRLVEGTSQPSLPRRVIGIIHPLAVLPGVFCPLLIVYMHTYNVCVCVCVRVGVCVRRYVCVWLLITYTV